MDEALRDVKAGDWTGLKLEIATLEAQLAAKDAEIERLQINLRLYAPDEEWEELGCGLEFLEDGQ